jgi:hypothetical protein
MDTHVHTNTRGGRGWGQVKGGGPTPSHGATGVTVQQQKARQGLPHTTANAALQGDRDHSSQQTESAIGRNTLPWAGDRDNDRRRMRSVGWVGKPNVGASGVTAACACSPLQTAASSGISQRGCRSRGMWRRCRAAGWWLARSHTRWGSCLPVAAASSTSEEPEGGLAGGTASFRARGTGHRADLGAGGAGVGQRGSTAGVSDAALSTQNVSSLRKCHLGM